VTTKAQEKSESRSRRSRVVSWMPEVSDLDIVGLLRQRDARGFDLAYARYAQRVFGFLVRLTRSRAVAEDLFQHTFLRLAERGSSLDSSSDLRAWLFSVARNAFYSQARAATTAARAEYSSAQAQAGAGPDSGLLLGELEVALARLTTEDRELLLLIGVEGLSHTEVAVMLGVDPVALRKRLSRARARLAAALDGAPVAVPEWEPEP
jgi:RNA polymerase sigma-70 factor (ECF subfamily)